MITDWINVQDEVPPPWLVVWVYWRDREVLLGCKTEKRDECEPTDCWYSFEDGKCRFTNWWMPVNAGTFDGPEPPKEPPK